MESERYARIINTVTQFDASGKDLRCIYCHLFQPYAPPSEAWVLDETVYDFVSERHLQNLPITNKFIFDFEETKDGVHWNLPPP